MTNRDVCIALQLAAAAQSMDADELGPSRPSPSPTAFHLTLSRSSSGRGKGQEWELAAPEAVFRLDHRERRPEDGPMCFPPAAISTPLI